jgi:hypothetical protein
MIGDHHGLAAGKATLLVRAVDDILGTHKACRNAGSQVPAAEGLPLVPASMRNRFRQP